MTPRLRVLSAVVLGFLFTLPILSQEPAPNVPRAEGGVIAPGARLEKLAGGFEFTEGPTSDRDGNVFFTDQPNDRILKWSVDGKLSTFLQPAGRSNGMYFDPGGITARARRTASRSTSFPPIASG